MNDVNDKVYVGKTEYSLQKRFLEHCRDSKKQRCEKRPLYNAMNKYGVERFRIELIEETECTSEREQHWIEVLNGYTHGYNATKGGDGKKYIDYEPIAKRLQETPYPMMISKEFGCSSDTVRFVAKKFGIKTKHLSSLQKTVIQLNPSTGTQIEVFDSVSAAAKSLGCENVCSTHISDVCKGKRKTAYGYKWQYAMTDPVVTKSIS
ncbi:MAG TPA: hypothetical protein DCW90_09495 [Lachnospiraceae bacterium]|nr:hypothetical protein [Lachnospiraceae bacterium]